MSVPMRRALSFQYLMEHKAIIIGEGELIRFAERHAEHARSLARTEYQAF